MNISDYKYKIETHCHTSPVSWCSERTPRQVIEAYKKAGVSAVCITNHFLLDYFTGGDEKEKEVELYLSDFYETKKIGKENGIEVILGMEIRFSNENSNDYLVYGIDEGFVSDAYDTLYGDLEEFYKKMKNDRNVILQAHPFRNGMELMDKNFIDGIETFNMHPNHNAKIALANRYYKENPHFIVTTGSDYHHQNHEATGLILSKTLPKDSFEFAELLKSKDYLFDIGGCIVLPYLDN